jgi:RES domain-containing protein
VISVWRISSDVKGHYKAEDVSGNGAKKSGGRWNYKGKALLYTSQSIALACLETFVHVGSEKPMFPRYLVRIDVPEVIWEKREILANDMVEVGWDAVPFGKVSQDIGDAWLAGSRSCLLVVPSVVIPEESNVLLNPEHPDMAYIKSERVREWEYDPRMEKGQT